MGVTVFVGGVTGSGKSTTCRSLASLLPGAEIHPLGRMACALASSHGLAAGSIETTPAEALDEVQRLLALQLEHSLNSRSAEFRILDGHFVLAGQGRATYRVPPWFFRSVGVTDVVLCDRDLEVIRSQIAGDASRVRPAIVKAELELYSREEQEHARCVAASLGVTLVVLRDAGSLTMLVRERLCRG